MCQAEAGDVDQHLHFIAVHEPCGDQLVHAFALNGRERLHRHTAFFHQILGVRRAENLEFGGVTVGHGAYPFLVPMLAMCELISVL